MKGPYAHKADRDLRDTSTHKGEDNAPLLACYKSAHNYEAATQQYSSAQSPFHTNKYNPSPAPPSANYTRGTSTSSSAVTLHSQQLAADASKPHSWTISSHTKYARRTSRFCKSRSWSWGGLRWCRLRIRIVRLRCLRVFEWLCLGLGIWTFVFDEGDVVVSELVG